MTIFLFITFPFVARELIPLMQSQGKDEEERPPFPSGPRVGRCFRVTLPNIKWGLLYGVILANARAMGEFGAVSVVFRAYSRRNQHTAAACGNPLQRIQRRGAFVYLITGAAGLVTLVAKTVVEWQMRKETDMLDAALPPEKRKKNHEYRNLRRWQTFR